MKYTFSKFMAIALLLAWNNAFASSGPKKIKQAAPAASAAGAPSTMKSQDSRDRCLKIGNSPKLCDSRPELLKNIADAEKKKLEEARK
jgi:hypothetical protein